MTHSKENIICGPDIPKYLLDSKSNLSQYFVRLLSDVGNKTAMVDAHDGSMVTFDTILKKSFNIANWLWKSGIQKSDIITIYSENTIWYPSIMLAAWHIGAICALMNPIYNNKELAHVLNITKPKMVITSNIGLDIVKSLASQLSYVKYVVPFDVIFDTKIIPEVNNFTPFDYDNNHTSVILFSSGTTGLPKGVELSHKSMFLLTSILKYNNTFVNDDDILMGLIPMFHGYGLLINCVCMSMGVKLIVLKYFDDELFLKSVEVHKITVIFAVPPLVLFLAKHPLIDNYDLSSLKHIYCGAAPLSFDIQKKVTERLGISKPLKVFQGYGMTELSILSTLYTQDTEKTVSNSVGKLINGMKGKVVDLNNGKSLGVNQSGELCFKGPMLMKGYYRNSKETSMTIDSDGWLHTGDIGYYDTDFNFFIVDRLKELIKYKGYQVAPAELESLLLTHSEIQDAAVTGLPNLEAGEVPMAFVVKSFDSNLTEKDVINFVHKHVSPQKRLRGGVKFVESIPKNPSGKILRRELKNLLNKSKL